MCKLWSFLFPRAVLYPFKRASHVTKTVVVAEADTHTALSSIRRSEGGRSRVRMLQAGGQASGQKGKVGRK